MDEDPQEEKKRMIQQVATFSTIPFVLALPPILGWLVGSWLDEKFNTRPVLMYVFVVLGFAAGFREVYQIVKRFGNGN